MTAGNKKVRGEMTSSQTSFGEQPLCRYRGSQILLSHAGEWRLRFFLIFFPLRFATYLGTPTVTPHLPSYNARFLRDREPHQSAGFPKKLPLSPILALGPSALLRGSARPAIEHAQRLDCCVPLPASRSARELAADEGLPRYRGGGNPIQARNGVEK